MKEYLLVVLLLVLLIVNFGFLLPTLFSMDSNEPIVLGVIIIIVLCPICYYVIKYITRRKEDEK